MTFDAALATAELDSFEILCVHHLRQMGIARDRRTCLLFATKLGTLAALAEHEAAKMRRERLCNCGCIVENIKVKICPTCGRKL